MQQCKLYNMQMYTFLHIVQLLLILYFQKVLEYLSSPQICLHWNSNNNLIRRVTLTY